MAEALGMIECMSFPATLEAADVMLKLATVQFISIEKTGGGCVTVLVSGELRAVKDAIELGVQAAEKVGEVLSLHVIDNAHPALFEHMKQSTSRL